MLCSSPDLESHQESSDVGSQLSRYTDHSLAVLVNKIFFSGFIEIQGILLIPVLTHPTWTALGLKPAPRGGEPETNGLSYGTSDIYVSSLLGCNMCHFFKF